MNDNVTYILLICDISLVNNRVVFFFQEKHKIWQYFFPFHKLRKLNSIVFFSSFFFLQQRDTKIASLFTIVLLQLKLFMEGGNYIHRWAFSCASLTVIAP